MALKEFVSTVHYIANPFGWFYSGQSLLIKTKHNITAVERRAARVISKFPFSPTSAGTRMNTSVITLKTSQCWKTQLQY